MHRIAIAALFVVAGCTSPALVTAQTFPPSTPLTTPATFAPAAPTSATSVRSSTQPLKIEPSKTALDVGDARFPGLGNPGYDVASYAINLKLSDDLASIAATTTITATATAELTEIHLDLRGLTVESVELDGKATTSTRAGLDLIIASPKSIGIGERFVANVTYHGRPQPLTAKDSRVDLPTGWLTLAQGTFVVAEPSGASSWFPSNDYPSDKATFVFTITAPSAKQVFANGLLDSKTSVGADTTWTYSMPDPMATYLATVVVGDYDVIRQTGPHGLPIEHAIAKGSTFDNATMDKIPAMISFFEDHFGPYPFRSYGTVTLPIGGGWALENQTRSLFANDAASDERLQAHELAHMWFGDSVSLTKWDDIWLNEGFATFAEQLWRDRDHPGSAPHSPNPPHSADALGHPDQLFDSTPYDKGAALLQELRHEVGDETFFSILPHWTADHRFANATTADFIALVEKTTKRSWKDFFNTWLN